MLYTYKNIVESGVNPNAQDNYALNKSRYVLKCEHLQKIISIFFGGRDSTLIKIKVK
jgi:hypothetical protein